MKLKWTPSWRLGFKGRSHAALLHAEHAACSPERDARAAAPEPLERGAGQIEIPEQRGFGDFED
jgi:hypothetical protein